MNEQETIEEIYEQAYEHGYAAARTGTPFFGSPPKLVGDIICPLDADDWDIKPRADFDPDNVVYVETEHNKYGPGNYSDQFLHYLDPDFHGYPKHHITEVLNLNPRVRVDVVENPANYIQQLKDRIKDIVAENEALRATHPAAGCEWEEDPKDLSPDADAEWSLEPHLRLTESRVPLSGSHPFDHAVVEYDVRLSACVETRGTVNTIVDITGIELVASN